MQRIMPLSCKEKSAQQMEEVIQPCGAYVQGQRGILLVEGFLPLKNGVLTLQSVWYLFILFSSKHFSVLRD